MPSASDVDNSDNLSLETVQASLEAEVCIPLATPVLKTRPRLRRSRTPTSVRSLRRSGRIAARPRAANATMQAQNVLLRKLGMGLPESATNAEINSQFKAAFGGNLSQRKKETMLILLNGNFNLPAMDLDLTGLEGEVAQLPFHVFLKQNWLPNVHKPILSCMERARAK